ncbi:MAG: PAS domain S-box protein [Gemmatimonadales bacterium]
MDGSLPAISPPALSSNQRRLGPAIRWGLTLLFNVGAILALDLAPEFLGRTPFLASGFASLFVLLFAGVIPAILTQAVTLLATDWFMIEPIGSFAMASPGDLGRFVLFIGFYGVSDLLAWRLEWFRGVSARRERALLESETRYRLILEQASDGIVLASPAGRLLMANPRACEMLGYRQEEILDLPITSFYAAGELEARPLAWDELARTSVVLRERRLRRKDGTTFDAELSVRRTADGLAQATIRDITERKRADEALRAERDLLEGILTTSVAGILVVNPDGRPMFLNAQAEHVLGVSRAVLMGRSDLPAGWRFYDLDGTPLPDEQRPTRRVVRTGEPVQGARLALERPGRRQILAVNAAPLKDTDRKVTAVVLSVADITEQYRAQETVRRSEETLQQITAAMPGVVYQLLSEPAGRVRFTFVSERAPEFLGVSARDILQDPSAVWRTVHPEDRRAMEESLRQAASDKEPWSADFRVLAPDGRVRWLRNVLTALPTRGQEPTTWCGVMVDVTERKRLEEELLQSQKMDSLGRLAGGVAHDFNNLLTVIRGYADVLMGELSEADPRLGEVREIRRASDRATSLTRQLLAVSRRQVMLPRTVELNGLVAEMERMLRRVIGEDISIATTVGADVWVRADPGQLEQVLLNLAVNARDAMPRGGTLTIETARMIVRESDRTRPASRGVPSGDYAMLRVTDSGVGMDSATAAKVFEPFFTTKPVGEGTGLGLSTVYGIVQQSSGYVTVESAPGAGATFRVYLPRRERREEPAAEVQRRGPAASGGVPRAKVLLVEDDDGVRQLTQRVLEEFGYDVTEARNGAEALAQMRCLEGAIDALVTDIVMPEMSGRELADELRGDRPQLPVLFLSGYTGDEVMEAAGRGRRMAFLQKPYSPDALAAALDELLADSRPATRD